MITEHRIKRWCYFRRLIAGKQHGFLRFATVLAFAARSKSSRFGYKTSKNWKPKHGYRFSMAEKRASEYLLLLLTDIISLRTRTFVTSVENILLWYKILDHGWILTAGTKRFLDRPCTFVRRKPRSIMCVRKNTTIHGEKITSLITSLYSFCALCYCNLFSKVFNEDYTDEYRTFYRIFWHKRFLFQCFYFNLISNILRLNIIHSLQDTRKTYTSFFH